MSDLKEFGLFLEKTRKENGYKSQRSLADRAGISSATISRIEAGEQKPLPETLKILAVHLKSVSYEELMERAGYLNEDGPKSNTINDQAKNEVLEAYNRLPQDKKKIIDDIIKALNQQQ